jgi:hypothetical protein
MEQLTWKASKAAYENAEVTFFSSGSDVRDVTVVSIGRLCVTLVSQVSVR